MVKTIKVKDLFDLSINTNSSEFTKSFINQNKGDIPVYGASQDSTKVGYGFVKDNIPGIKYFEDCLTWNIDGSMCVIHKRSGRFSLSEKVIPLVLFEKWKGTINEEFLKLAIESEARNCGFGYGHKAGKTKLGEIEISIPIDIDGIIDLEKQKEIVSRYNKIQKIQSILKKNYEILSTSLVQIDDKFRKTSVKLDNKVGNMEIFQLEIGKRVLKKNVKKCGIPLYSANVFEPFGYVEESNIEDFTKPSIIWGIDGVFDWNYIEPNIVFATTDHCGRLRVNIPTINPKYIWYQLRLSANTYGFNRVFRASLQNLKEQVVIEIPVTENDEFDINAQNELVKKYELIERMRLSICTLAQQGAISTIDL